MRAYDQKILQSARVLMENAGPACAFGLGFSVDRWTHGGLTLDARMGKTVLRTRTSYSYYVITRAYGSGS